MSYEVKFGLRGHDISRESLKDMVDKAEKLGVERVQFAMRVTMADIAWENGMFSYGFAKMIKQTLEEKNISVPVLSSYVNLTDMSEREEKQFIDTIKFASVIGAGMVGSETGRILDPDIDTHSEEAYQRVLKNVRRLVDVAEKLGVMIGIEPVSFYTIHSPESLKRLIDDVNSPNLCVIFDLVNITTVDNYKDMKNTIEKSFELFGDRINAIHLKDISLEDGKIVRKTPGEGSIDFNHYFSLLKAKKPYIDIILDELPSSLYEEVSKNLIKIWDEA